MRQREDKSAYTLIKLQNVNMLTYFTSQMTDKQTEKSPFSKVLYNEMNNKGDIKRYLSLLMCTYYMSVKDYKYLKYVSPLKVFL